MPFSPDSRSKTFGNLTKRTKTKNTHFVCCFVLLSDFLHYETKCEIRKSFSNLTFRRFIENYTSKRGLILTLSLIADLLAIDLDEIYIWHNTL